MALTLAAGVIGCSCAEAPAAGPPPHSPMATLRSSSSSAPVRGCWLAMAADGCAVIWVVVWVKVVMINCERSLFAIAKNGVRELGVSGASGSFISAGLIWIVTSKVSFSVSDSLVGML